MTKSLTKEEQLPVRQNTCAVLICATMLPQQFFIVRSIHRFFYIMYVSTFTSNVKNFLIIFFTGTRYMWILTLGVILFYSMDGIIPWKQFKLRGLSRRVSHIFLTIWGTTFEKVLWQNTLSSYSLEFMKYTEHAWNIPRIGLLN